ncbi:GNAT family N-acetyltransferase [Vibrio sp.]|uniref:GNAT family N-acetyltransferase n=1 Tax=Vibrio sp. TaxID=678 RepID=UPI003D0E5E5E
MLIRTEAPADILAIDRLLAATFDSDQEAKLVMQLRENSRLTLSLVACTDDGEVVGYVLFTPVLVDGEDFGWQGLAPLAVRADYRGQGIGGQLVREGLASLLEFGYPACVVLGDPAYYSQFGFADAALHGLRCQWSVPEGAFQFCSMAELAPISPEKGQLALVSYSPEFGQVFPEDGEQ